jgi:hypothetical protein
MSKHIPEAEVAWVLRNWQEVDKPPVGKRKRQNPHFKVGDLAIPLRSARTGPNQGISLVTLYRRRSVVVIDWEWTVVGHPSRWPAALSCLMASALVVNAVRYEGRSFRLNCIRKLPTIGSTVAENIKALRLMFGVHFSGATIFRMSSPQGSHE